MPTCPSFLIAGYSLHPISKREILRLMTRFAYTPSDNEWMSCAVRDTSSRGYEILKEDSMNCNKSIMASKSLSTPINIITCRQVFPSRTLHVDIVYMRALAVCLRSDACPEIRCSIPTSHPPPASRWTHQNILNYLLLYIWFFPYAGNQMILIFCHVQNASNRYCWQLRWRFRCFKYDV